MFFFFFYEVFTPYYLLLFEIYTCVMNGLDLEGRTCPSCAPGLNYVKLDLEW